MNASQRLVATLNFEKMKDGGSVLETFYPWTLSAERWSEEGLSKNYSRNGNIWLFVSIIIALITIVGLVLFIIFTPSLFDNDGDLYLILKNTALLTVVTSIAIYIKDYY